MATSPEKPLRVRTRSGADSDVTRTYLPVSKALLRPGHILPFHLYSHETAGQLRRVAESGAVLPGSLFDAGGDGKARRYYIRADQRAALVKYQEEVLAEFFQFFEVDVAPFEVKPSTYGIP